MTRIYRDARRLHNRGPYKESLWFSIEQPSEEWTSRPTFWFELMPDGWTYGMGYWMPKPLTMAKLRARIDRDPDTMSHLMRKLRRQQEFVLETEDYKRPRSQAPSKILEPWYRAKGFTFCHNGKLEDELFCRGHRGPAENRASPSCCPTTTTLSPWRATRTPGTAPCPRTDLNKKESDQR